MRRVLFIACFFGLLTGCAIGGGPYVADGLIFSSVRGPLGAGPSAKAPKTGEACGSNILGLVSTGNNSINAAKENGNINKIATVDYKRFTVLGATYQSVCTIVTGI